MSTVQGWGPRPGGPPPGPPPPAPGPTGCLIAVMALLGTIGFGLLFSKAFALGLVLVLGSGAYFAVVLSRPGREQAARSQRASRQEAEASAWWSTRPEQQAAAASDPHAAVRGFTHGVFLGVSPDHREWTTAEPQQAVIVLGPPRSGKTSSLIVPAVLAASGPVVSTSTKLDVLEATARTRSRLGRVWVFDPSGTETLPPGALELHWSPVTRSRTWDGARTIADAMVGASSAGQGVENATYWADSAKTLLGPLLHAAAISGRSVQDVRRWVSRMWLEEAGEILEEAGASFAADNLSAIWGTDPRERSSIFATTRLVLDAYGSASAADRSASQNIDCAAFVRSTDTVYVTAPSHLQHVLAPLVAGLLEDIRTATYELARHRVQGRAPAGPPVLWALDEVANIAPIQKLPGIVSEAGGQGLQVMACFQDLSQARGRWGPAADGFLTLFGTKVVFAGIGDRPTLEALSMLAGDWDRPYQVFNTNTGQSTQFGLPLGMSRTNQTGHGYAYSTQREALLSPSEIANIPVGHALTVRANRWGLVAATPFYAAAPWTAVTARAPAHIQFRGGVDLASDPPAPVEVRHA